MKPLAQNTLIQNRYLIVQLIGKGGMGEVYLAVDQRLGSAVAIKRTFYSGDDALGNAFEREAKILARLRHAVLPKVSDHFSEDEEQYLVMEHISGEDLSKRLETSGKSFPVTWVLFWADQLLDALSYLHSHEPPIIHRDIKPQNLKLTDDNHIVLLDFGLSKNGVGQTKVPDASKSSTSSVVGYTPHYAPMEQIRGIGTSPRSDLYGLAATLYQLITNQIPADALSRADSLLNGMEDPITPIHELNPEISVGVSDVIMKAMEVSQEKRFATAREMQKKLRKAFAKMQEAMTAQTVAFNINDTDAELPAPTVPPILPTNDIEDSKTVTDFNQTLMQAPEPEVRQADLKTEVFVAGAMNDVDSAPMADDNYGATVVENFSTNDRSDETPAFSPEATVPFIAVNNDILGDTPAAEESVPESFFTEPNISDAADHIPQESTGFFTEPNVNLPQEDQTASEPKYNEEEVAAAPVAAVAGKPNAKAKKKGGAGKFIIMLLGLGFVFALILGAIGGVWYYMNEMQGGTVDPTPTPMIEVTPTPMPTETPFSGLDDNSNTNTDPETPTPTPEETQTPEPDVTPDNGQTGPTKTPFVPKPRPTNTRPDPRPTSTKPLPTRKPGAGPTPLQ